MVEAAIYAPSGDNCQPWRFQWNGDALRILFAPERAESLYDVNHLASWISLGAVLENLELAAGARGLRPVTELWPDGEGSDVAARIRLARCEPTESPLLLEIPKRSVNRRPYRRAPLPAGVREELMAAGAAISGVQTRLIEDRVELSRLAGFSALNDRVLFENRLLHSGLQRWLRWNPEEVFRTRDGMPIGSLELAMVERPGFRLLSAWPCARLLGIVGGTRLLPLRARRTYCHSAALGLVTVKKSEARAFVCAGRVVERIWLTATRRQVAFQPITGITFLLLRLWLGRGEGLDAGHRRLLEQVGHQFREALGLGSEELPVMLFRLGFADPPSARAPRLALTDLLSITVS
jgi:hypothetical protein